MILTELLQKVEKSALDEQVKQICDEIMKEEMPKMLHVVHQPTGPNVFLSIECSDVKNINFLCLERESKEKYIICLWSRMRRSPDNSPIKRKTVWEVTDLKAEKILKTYAEKLKFIRGE